MNPLKVVEYNPEWQKEFCRARSFFSELLQGMDVDIVHIGSTSVEGLWAKPVLDIDIIVRDRGTRNVVIRRLAKSGYIHLGDLGIEGREAFSCPGDNPNVGWMDHHLYVCIEGCAALRNHLLLKNHLLMNKDAVREYSRLKRLLAQKYPDDPDGYCAGKTGLITSFLAVEGMGCEDIGNIAAANCLVL